MFIIRVPCDQRSLVRKARLQDKYIETRSHLVRTRVCAFGILLDFDVENVQPFTTLRQQERLNQLVRWEVRHCVKVQTFFEETCHVHTYVYIHRRDAWVGRRGTSAFLLEHVSPHALFND